MAMSSSEKCGSTVPIPLSIYRIITTETMLSQQSDIHYYIKVGISPSKINSLDLKHYYHNHTIKRQKCHLRIKIF